KVLSFNQQLRHNDGLLCNHIAEIEKIPYSQAVELIQNEVAEYENTLKTEKQIAIDNVGSLTLIAEGGIIFKPNKKVNYLTSSFGLSDFSSVPVDRVKHKEVVEAVEEAAPIAITHESRKKRNWLGYAAAAVLILGLGSFGAFKYYEKEVNTHNLLVQEEANKAVESKVQEATFVISNPLPNALFEIEKQSGNFHVVAGAFRVEANSDKKVRQLKDLGYKARKIGVNKYGLHEVVYSSYQTRTEAQKALRSIRSTHNPEAWLLIKKLD
ncbi:MAG: SPOR domain-containing protein, partial [Bacteroidota bacterium]